MNDGYCRESAGIEFDRTFLFMRKEAGSAV